jgi:hypothetical protein
MYVLMADGELVELAPAAVDCPAEQVFLPGQHVGQIVEGAGAVEQIELPARGVRHGARIPQATPRSISGVWPWA